jgi:SAM-dependent methyltransferase
MSTRVSPSWLRLREQADAAARARDLVNELRDALPATGPLTIHDLGCGTGAMGRWLAPLLPGPQHWVAHDRDADLLALAVAGVPGPAADGSPVTVEARHTDLAQLRPSDVAGASVITASALLDVLTEPEMSGLAAVCASARCPILLTLTVTGAVEIVPANRLDGRIAAAFNAHQRRRTERGRLLGPDAVPFAAHVFGRIGADVVVRPSPWRLGPSDADLTAEWFAGWMDAASEQDSDLAAACEPYARRRRAEATAGGLAVTVGHADVLVRL